MNAIYYSYFNKITRATIGRFHFGKRPNKDSSFRKWLQLSRWKIVAFPCSLSYRHSAILSILNPTKLTLTLFLCTCNFFYLECSFSQLFAGLGSYHSVSAHMYLFKAIFPDHPSSGKPLPGHSQRHQSICFFFIELITAWNTLLYLCVNFIFLSPEYKLPCLSRVPRIGLFVVVLNIWSEWMNENLN